MAIVEGTAEKRKPAAADNMFRMFALQVESLARPRKRRPVPMLIAILLIAAIVVLFVYFVSQMNTVIFREPLYRYDTGVRFDYGGTTRIQRDGEQFVLRSDNGTEQEIGHTPIYFPDGEKMFLTGQLLVVRPEEEQAPVRTGYFTTIQKGKAAGVFTAKVNRKTVEIEKGFLFDGQNEYIFLEPVTVEWNERSVELPAFSCAVVYYNLRLEIYPAGSEDEIAIEQTGEATVMATAKSGAYSVDLSKDILKSQGNELLLFTQPSLLDFIS
jgi:hypothetical protein